MKRNMRMVTALISAMGMMILILDAKTALFGAAEGITLCISTVIPSLFPFFLFSILLTGSLSGMELRILNPICRALKVPESAASLLIIGLLGGYPTGAQSIALACQNGTLHRKEAKRMLAFCSNAGPAFIFGIGAAIFEKIGICFMIWLIHVASAVIVGILTPSDNEQYGVFTQAPPIGLTQALKKALQTMALVCGWVVIFRILLAFFSRWFLWLFPPVGQTVIFGLLELTNGCCMLSGTENMGLNMLLFCGFLSFGGFCVAIQTYAVNAGSGVDMSLYLPGKITQAAVSVLLCSAVQPILPAQYRWHPNVFIFLSCLTVCICYGLLVRRAQKSSSISECVGV